MDLLAEEVVRHEPGEEDYSGDHRGREQVVALLAEVWFRPDGYDPDTDSAVFGFG